MQFFKAGLPDSKTFNQRPERSEENLQAGSQGIAKALRFKKLGWSLEATVAGAQRGKVMATQRLEREGHGHPEVREGRSWPLRGQRGNLGQLHFGP